VNELFERLQRTLGDTYRLDRELGGGGMSHVFLATEAALRRQVVIKLLAPELTSEVSTARFKREFELTALLQHPHILPVLAAGARDGLLYYVMPYVDGESLRHRILRDGRLPVGDTIRMLSELAGALAYAHERGIVHRDIKPENILLSNGVAVLADFGIAAALAGPRSGETTAESNATRLTEVGTSMGTPGYMSPEQAAGETNLDGRSDIYSLAVVGYEMLAGAPPFVRPTPLATMTAHLSEPPKPVEELRPDTPPALSEALLRALAKEPAQRFQSAKEFGEALGMWSSGPSRSASRRRASRWVAAAVIASIVVGGGWYFRRATADPGMDRNLIAVAPFEVLDQNLGVWREGLVDVLSTNLDGAGPLRTVSPAVVIRRWSGRSTRDDAAALGRRTGAGLAVFGRIVPSGADSVRLTASVVDVAAGRSMVEIEIKDASARMDRLADSLSIRILRELNQTRTLAAVRRSTIGSSSLGAIKAYLQGEQHFRRSDWDSATFYYQRAIDQDSMFAPAMRHLSNAMGWKLGPSGELQNEGYKYALRAGQLNRGLAPRESLLVVGDSIFSALITWNQGPTSERTALGKRLFQTLEVGTRRFPDDPELWYKLGDARQHFFVISRSKVNFADARAAFDRAIALDSAFAPAYIHPIDVAVGQQDIAGARRYIRAYLALDPIDVHAASVRLLAALIDHPPTQDSLERAIASMQQQAVRTAFNTVLYLGDSAETQVRMARALGQLASKSDSPQARNGVRAGLVTALSTRGHIREAMTTADSTMSPWLVPEAALLGVVPADSARRTFAAWLAHPIRNELDYTRVMNAARWWAESGDTASIQQVVKAVDGPGFRALAADMARGYLAVARRDTTDAIRRLSFPDSACIGDCALPRLVLAQLLSARGQDREAAAILDQEFFQPIPSRVVWMLERARVNERIGERAKAIDSYAFVASAWQRADPELQPAVVEAKSALKRLGVRG
jgi:eukaryotic-like serine/threonine-protein kinase